MNEERDTRPVIAFTGGGTGGHIYPGLSIVDRLREKIDARIVWIGSSKGMDRSIIEGAGLEFLPIPAGKLRRNLSLKTIPDAFRVLAGYFASRRILRRLAPSLLFSKGGYVSVPPCAAAKSLGIPVFTHESDVSPGLATRLNARFASRIFVSYPETADAFGPSRRDKVAVAGNPVRKAFYASDAGRGRAWLGASPGIPIVLAMGGSQGARQINELVTAALPLAEGGGCFIAHQTGAEWTPVPSGNYRAFEYIKGELPDLIAAADLIVTRAGAGSLWECAAAGKPMLLVPLEGASTRGDQVENARYFERRGAAVVLSGTSAAAERFIVELRALLADSERRAAIGKAASAIGANDAADTIADAIVSAIKEGSGRT
jgi:UDP-N-acetylglucosamine--N-acetylmuramyl-(pentapeptide) pyrophosphoryl-undecaprenol N-acetylglucosamine transferase